VNPELRRRALLLSYITVAYNIGEGLFSILAGTLAGSTALVGFGLDSFVESLSGAIMIWRFRRDEEVSEEERLEAKAAKLVGYTFFVLAAYVTFESVEKLYLGKPVDQSLPGIVIAVVSLIVMPVLFYEKYRTGKALGSRSLVADSRETLACVFLSAALLVGLTLNYTQGIWQADPAIGLVISFFLLREGVETLGKE
jgi:divalent metal cation (Fe/Co/Zn/Cd) transporter